ncbi:MAG: exodeoxyribonuclease VII small subunit [Thermoguttaceae bacterium]
MSPKNGDQINSNDQTVLTKNSEKLGFEESLALLDEIVHKLEDGKTDLETALQQYEKGVDLLKGCHRILEFAQRKIEILRGFNAEGKPQLEHVEEATFRTT